jgi:hypothetical protein
MQAGGAARGAGTIPRRGRLEVLLAIAVVVVVTVMVAFVMWTLPITTSGVEDAIPGAGGAGPAIIHDDAGSMNRFSNPLPAGKVAVLNASNTGAGSAVVHDDAGNVPRGAGSAAVHDDAGNVNR